jgi:hypothetical protein
MKKSRFLGLLAAAPMLLLPAAPAFAQTAPPASSCGFHFGFADLATLIPDQVGHCVADSRPSDDQGDIMQETNKGLMTWSKATNVVEFTNGARTWVSSPYGVVLRDATTSYNWEGATSLVAGITINAQGNPIDPLTGMTLPTDARYKVGS